MQIPEAAQSAGTVLNTLPPAVVVSGLFGIPWNDIVNILAAFSLVLQILWFVATKAIIIYHQVRKHGKDSSQ